MNRIPKFIIDYFAAITILIGLAGVSGWVFKLPLLYTFLSNGASMKFITALCTVLAGAALLSLHHRKKSIAQWLSLAAGLISIATVTEYLLNRSLGVDIVFFDSISPVTGELPGRMSLYTAILFMLVSLSAFLFTTKKFYAAQSLALLGTFMAYSALLGNLFDIGHLFTFGHFSAVSFPTAFSLLTTYVGLLFCSAGEGWLPEVFIQSSVARAARYAIFYFFIATPLFVGLFLASVKYTTLPPEFTVVILIMGTVACTIPFAFRLLKKMNRAEENLHRLAHKLKKRSRELARKNETLSRMNADLDNIIHIISHDLKTPITSLQLSLDILEMEAKRSDNETLQTLASLPKRSVRQLNEMIVHLSDTLKAQRPEEMPPEAIDICALVEGMKATGLAAAIKNTGAIVHMHIDDCIFLYERIHLHSILQNLISNGIKYHVPGRQPVVEVSATKVQGGILLAVQDNGLGIPETEMKHLFTKYKRFHGHVEGTGVGLYLTRKLVEARGGQITAQSREGEGTIFTVFLPMKKTVSA